MNVLKPCIISPEKQQQAPAASVFLMDQHIKTVNPIMKDLLVPVRSHKKSSAPQGSKKNGGGGTGAKNNENYDTKRTVIRDNQVTDDAAHTSGGGGKPASALIRSTSKTKVSRNYNKHHH